VAEEHNVFLRWARLKQAAIERGDAVVAPTDGRDPTAPPVTDAVADQPFDLANLPSIESIAANTDIAAFLRTGVPDELTRAALRRAWTSDPAVCDFIGIAENQWDFNDPNAIPGFGPLDPVENAVDVFAQVSGRLEQIPDALADIVPPVNATPPRVAVSTEPDLDQRFAAGEPRFTDGRARPDEIHAAAASRKEEPIEESRIGPRMRRHGSALPR
jgi:hypothetical protein